MALITEENLPTVVGILWSMTTVYILRDVFKNVHLWRKGASARSREALGYVAEQLEKCSEELDAAQDERDQWRQKVGRRDHVILAHGLKIPQDGRRTGDVSDGPSRTS